MNDYGYKVLLVDDEPNILRALTRLMRSSSVQILTANSGEEALKLLEHEQVALVVSDYRMPGINGLELLSRVRDIDPDTVRMIISGQSDMKTVVTAINEGEVFRFITKPWNDLDVQVSISLALAHRRLLQDKRDLADEVKRLQNILIDIQKADPALFERILSSRQEPQLDFAGNGS